MQSAFARAVEAEYQVREARYRAAGAGGDAAHRRALEEATELARVALDDLRRRGHFPWPATASVEGGHA
jgi:hypothetical protein